MKSTGSRVTIRSLYKAETRAVILKPDYDV